VKMKLTVKDKEFLERLKEWVEEGILWVELRDKGIKHFVLRGNYGSRIETRFGMTRQGIRWRFQRLFNQIYVSAYETILFVEGNFGTDLRPQAIEICQERVVLRHKNQSAEGRDDRSHQG